MEHGIQKRDKRLSNHMSGKKRGQVMWDVTYVNALIKARNSQVSILRHEDKRDKHTSQRASRHLLASLVHGPRFPEHYAVRLT